MDIAIQRINHYPAHRVVCFVNTYPLDSDLSSDSWFVNANGSSTDLD